MLEDSELVYAYVREGDVKAFSSLVVRHSPWMTAYLRGMLGDLGEAEDALQEVWLKVLRAIGRYRGGVVRAYLLQAARSEAYTRLGRRRHPVVAGRVDVEAVEVRDDAPGPAVRSETRELAGRVRAAVAGLPEREREVMLMRVEGGFRYEEIAADLGVPLNTVHCWMHRARETLKKVVKGVEHA